MQHLELDNIINSVNGYVAVKIVDPLSNNVLYAKNTSQTMPMASVNKLIIANYLINQRNVDLFEAVSYERNQILQGSGILKFLDTNHQFTPEELMKLMLIISDNSASKILISLLGVKNINEFSKEIGLSKTKLKALGSKFLGWGLSTADDQINLLEYIYNQRNKLFLYSMENALSTESVGKHFVRPYEGTSYRIYAKGGTLHPNVKNTSFIISRKNKTCLCTFLSKDLASIDSSKEAISLIGEQVAKYLV